VAASVPERHYDLAASLLAEAVAESTRTGMPVDACLHAAARAAGRQIGEEAATALHAEEPGRGQQAVLDVLAHHGYEPRIERQEIALANCPFHRLAEQQRTLVCGMNLDFLDGLLEGMSSTDRLAARLDPAPGFCCVRIATA
jgi:predicted ArsR family transcriptional regulator